MNKKRIIAIVLVLTIITSALVALSGCNTKTYNDTIKYVIEDNGEITIVEYTDKTYITEVDIPDEIDGIPVTKIADFGVVDAESIRLIKIGKNVREIGDWAFTNNQNLDAFEVSPENEHFVSVEGVLFTKDMKKILFYPCGKGSELSKKMEVLQYASYVIPEGVEVIGEHCFWECYYVENLTLPSTLKAIEEKAFYAMSALKGITLPEGLEVIEKDAFTNCNNETFSSIVIPSTIKEIGDFAFYNCGNIKNITINRDESEIAFGNKWYPTNEGRKIKELVITCNGQKYDVK